MTDRPYTEDDLRAEAARQYYTATTDPDFVGIGEQMQDQEITPEGGVDWGDLGEENFDAAQRAVDDLLGKAADVSKWAIDLGADGLEPEDHTLTVDGDDKPLVRLHCAFSPDLDDRARISFMSGLARAMANAL